MNKPLNKSFTRSSTPCLCGCGQFPFRGKRFVAGHHLPVKHSEETRRRQRETSLSHSRPAAALLLPPADGRPMVPEFFFELNFRLPEQPPEVRAEMYRLLAEGTPGDVRRFLRSLGAQGNRAMAFVREWDRSKV